MQHKETQWHYQWSHLYCQLELHQLQQGGSVMQETKILYHIQGSELGGVVLYMNSVIHEFLRCVANVVSLLVAPQTEQILLTFVSLHLLKSTVECDFKSKSPQPAYHRTMAWPFCSCTYSTFLVSDGLCQHWTALCFCSALYPRQRTSLLAVHARESGTLDLPAYLARQQWRGSSRRLVSWQSHHRRSANKHEVSLLWNA